MKTKTKLKKESRTSSKVKTKAELEEENKELSRLLREKEKMPHCCQGRCTGIEETCQCCCYVCLVD